ncbi:MULTISPECIES: peptidoglycan D,D-transpeptidase FtsI family protein [Streptomyces]|uniref:Penicillin-binding protein transpeptidase n=2 Tax=Streptomyces malaysiensis TaxID=92644 RepID=A0A291STD7_STRMQ|nr:MULTISPECIES: penicillin-binding protein 2 [Streptomyces]MYX54584.1 penicillin-binding protein 2 [Streptomyces sp. SID8382]ATL84156.1 penicillin-binding protein [Streptomyces malaysiensis]AUA12570.1 Penicillin-binding protein A [Streptomyces sp. M56]MCQ8829645.1 penicillin-binding protein 2 [Streptomyces samsunensis]NIY66833.1 penicillin-binding protein transpeptidase [Streptomyces malaysiensis]
MNKPLRRIAIFCGLLVFALLLRDNWIQYVQADELKDHTKNRRVLIARYSQPRGNIIVDGQPITGSAETNGTDFKYKRTYKNGPMWAPVTGYASQAYDANQIEKIEDGILTGNDDRLFFNRTIDMITGKKQKGGDVITTLNGKAQEAAFKGLGNKKGAVAALDPRTGKILALASTPSYDPSTIAGGSTKDEKAWNALKPTNDKDDPMLNRALRQTYPPGSTFKVVTAAAALENGKYDDIDGPTESPLPWRLPLSTQNLPNEGNIPCKDASLRQALRYSCNTVFGKLGDDLGKDKMREQAEKFGFNKTVDTPVRAYASVYPEDMDRPGNAMSAIGQFDNRATPLQMAMVAAAVANDGKLMKPYMVDSLRAPNLNTVEQTDPEQMSQPLSSENAQKLQSMMETVVKEGTGTSAQIPGVTVGGKTGTAQHGVANSKNPYAWFISYAKGNDGSPVAVAVVIEGSDTLRGDIAGGKLAAPIAKSVMQAVLETERDK